jgi:hypothetical protein
MESSILTLVELLNSGKKIDEVNESLLRLMRLELEFNLKLIDTLRWKNVSDDFRKVVIKRLNVENTTALLCFTDNNLVNHYVNKIHFSNESKMEQISDINILTSIISRIQVLQALVDIGDDFEEIHQMKLADRVRNLSKLLVKALNIKL